MARLPIFSLVSWLLFVQVTTALAAVSQQKRVRKQLPAQRSTQELIAPPIPPQVAGTPKKNTAKQQGPTTTEKDDTKKRRYIAEAMLMQRAWMYAAVLPGWGQLYNRHYWKVPAIYAVFAGLGWGAIYNHRAYVNAKRELIQENGGYRLRNYVDDCRRDRDLCIIFAALWYVANIFDAYVGASLKTFNLSDDISLEMQPSMLPTAQTTPMIGLSLTLSFAK